MPIKTTFSNNGGVIVHTATGLLSPKGIKKAYEKSLEHAVSIKNPSVIWDLRDSDASEIYEKDIEEIANYILSLSKKRAGYKAGLVVSRDLEYGLARMYGAYVKDGPADIQVFRNFEQAMDWVRET